VSRPSAAPHSTSVALGAPLPFLRSPLPLCPLPLRDREKSGAAEEEWVKMEGK